MPKPVGTVTVVVADVEGSTPLMERLGEARFTALLAEYEALLRGRAEEHGGTAELAAGDGHLLAFPGARAGLRWAVAVQRDLAAAGAPPVRVRMGIHSGELERRNGELRGRALWSRPDSTGPVSLAWDDFEVRRAGLAKSGG